MTDVTQILNQIEQGDPSASDKLLPLLYDELRVLARQRLTNEKPGQTLQATALVHEVYLRLIGNDNESTGWNSRGHFFGAAAEAMRRILIENARRKGRIRHGGAGQRLDLMECDVPVSSSQVDLLELDDALRRLEAEDPGKALLVKLRFFAGLTVPEAAKVLGISVPTAERYWIFAKTWLFAELSAPS